MGEIYCSLMACDLLYLIILSLMFRILYLFFDTSLIENSIELDPIL